jgi:hypothetical protein
MTIRQKKGNKNIIKVKGTYKSELESKTNIKARHKLELLINS